MREKEIIKHLFNRILIYLGFNNFAINSVMQEINSLNDQQAITVWVMIKKAVKYS